MLHPHEPRPLPSTPTRNKQVPPRNKYRNRWTSALPKWVPKRPVTILPSEKAPWHDGWTGMCILPNINLTHETKQTKPWTNKTEKISPVFPNLMFGHEAARNILYVLKWEKLFPHVFSKKNLNPKSLELESFENYQFFTAFSKGFCGSHQEKTPKIRIECCFGIGESCRFGSHKGSNDGTHLG